MGNRIGLNWQMQIFSDREAASQALADHIQSSLHRQLEAVGKALLVASGGNSPIRCFDILSGRNLEWDRVYITLSDERCVPVDHPQSNEKLVRDHLLRDKAAGGSFIPPDDARLGSLLPAACSLLGMGEDGHFASLFPDSPQLQQGLKSKSQTIQVMTPSSEFQRISMTLPAILNTNEILLLVFGEKKRQQLENPEGLPIEHLLNAADINIFCAP